MIILAFPRFSSLWFLTKKAEDLWGLKNLILEAEKIGIIGEDPQKHWNKNKTTCKILIKNSK